MTTTTAKRQQEEALLAEVIQFTEKMETVETGDDLAECESRRKAIHEKALKIQEGWASDAQSASVDATAETLEGVYKITDPDTLERNKHEARKSLKTFEQKVLTRLGNNQTVAFTELPGVISPNALPEGSGACPEFHYYEGPNPIAGAIKTGPNEEAGHVTHMFYQPRLRVPESQLDAFPSHKIGFADAPDANGERREKSYSALSMNLGKFINTTQTAAPGSPGTGVIPGGITFDPTPEMLDAFEGPMTSPMLWNVKVTPGDISRLRVLQFIKESEAQARAEAAAANPSNPNTAEAEVDARKISTDLRVTKEVLMDNYLNSFMEAFQDQAMHEHRTEVSEALTTGNGTAPNPTGIMTHIDAISGVPNLGVASIAGGDDSLAINQVTLLQMKALLKPGLRRAPLVFMARDAVCWRLLISQLNNTAPGFSLPLDTSVANDDMGLHGRMWGMYIQANEGITAPSTTANSTIAVIVSGKSFCVRTTGTTSTLNPWDKMEEDIISVYLRTWSNTVFTKPQVTGNFTAGRLRTT